MIRPRKAIERIQKYRPPLEGRRGKLRLDFNENTVGCAPDVWRALRDHLNEEWFTCYPEYEEGRERLAKFFGLASEELVLTNGTDDALKVICETFVDPGDVLVVPRPTFPVYQFFHEVAGGKTLRVSCDRYFRLPLRKFLSAVKHKPRWVALGSPNNPTGAVIPAESLRAILETAPRSLVVVDEAYADFSGGSVRSWVRHYSNLVVTRTFSKAFGLAALRMGCVFAHRTVAEMMRRGQNPFPVNALALQAACVAIEHLDYVRRYVEEVTTNRARLSRWLEGHDLPYVPSQANFLLAHVGARAAEIAQRLRQGGILIRNWSYDPLMEGYLRFTIGSTAQTDRFLAAMAKLAALFEPHRGQKFWQDFGSKSATGWFT